MGQIGGYSRRGRGVIVVATMSLTACAGFQPHSWHHPTIPTTRSSLPQTRAHASSSTALSLSIPAAPAVSAFATLSISAAAGIAADKMKVFGGGGSGTVVSLLVASVLSNIGLAPTSHPLYDICWTKLLPASLALMLMAGFDGDGNNGTSIRDTTEDEVKSTVKNVSIPFAIGCLGSIVGCLLSFMGSLLMSTNAGRWALPPLDAATAAGCLCSSFIGGTVNLFATARILGSGPNAIDLESLLGSMAAADLLVMALYFAGLTAAVKSSYLQRIFPGRLKDARRGREESAAGIVGTKADASIESQVSASIGRQLYREVRPATAGTFASALAFLIVGASTRFERSVYSLFGIPGMGCAAIAVLSTAVGWILQKGQEKELFPWLQKEMNRVCPRLSGLCFSLLFATIGTAANVGVALRHGAASFLFASSALLVHFVTILLGSLAMTKIIPKVKLSIEEVAVASNAAIGGPATAAAFAGSLGAGKDVIGESKRRGLVLAGTTWGGSGCPRSY